MTKATARSQLDPGVLRLRVLQSLRDQGFKIGLDGLIRPGEWDKETIRNLHAQALRARIERARAGLERHENRLLGYIADGAEVDPGSIAPLLREVRPDTE